MGVDRIDPHFVARKTRRANNHIRTDPPFCNGVGGRVGDGSVSLWVMFAKPSPEGITSGFYFLPRPFFYLRLPPSTARYLAPPPLHRHGRAKVPLELHAGRGLPPPALPLLSATPNLEP